MTWPVIAVAALVGAVALVVWLRHRFVVVDVDGPSMRPTLHAGDRVLVRRRRLRHLRAGDIVVVESPPPDRNVSGHGWIVKRAAAVPGDPVPASVAAAVSAAPGTAVPAGCLVVLGDNAAGSLDSRHYGYVSGAGVLGVALRRLAGGGTGKPTVGR